jgi:SNF2 family DNA or RNA helicase
MLKTALLRMVDVFPAVELMRGKDYAQKGHVLNIRLSDGLLKGRVKGLEGRIYDVHIDLKEWPKVPSRCNCSDSLSCRHAVACFVALQIREHITDIPSLPDLNNNQAPNLSQTVSFFKQKEIIHADDLEWYSDLYERGHDFFAYQLGILIDGKPVSVVSLVADLITRWDHVTLERLPDDKLIHLPLTEGKVIEIELGRLKPLLRFLLHDSVQPEGIESDLRVQQYQLLLMQEAEHAMAATRARWRGTERVRSQLMALTALTCLPVINVPKGLRIQLREYQHQGLNWLQFLRANHFSGVLADDMGLGKTVQTLAHLQYEKQEGRMNKASLIVAPTSLMGNWLDEIRRFTPDLKTVIFHGAARHLDEFDDFDVIISTYGLIQRDKRRFLAYDFYYVILDEAQFIKNSRTKTTQVVQQLRAHHRLCLTGTPIENHLGELWSLFHFLMPGLLGDAKQFRQFFRVPIEREGDVDRRELLTRRVQPFMLRRTKDQVARELPAKTEITRMIDLSGSQRDLYEAIRMSMEKKVREAIAKQGLGKSQIVLLDALLKLRQVCCDPRLVALPEAVIAHHQSAKLDALMELLDNLMLEGRSVLVFSQFTSMLKLIEAQLVAREYGYLKLTGQTQHRQALVRRFQEGDAPIFLISLKAGGTGLNLTRADTVILYDPWWNPAVQNQATDRSHRIGQKNPVFVYKLITKGTVEEAIVSIQEKKQVLFDGLLSNKTTGGVGLTEADITQFFMPLESAE